MDNNRETARTKRRREVDDEISSMSEGDSLIETRDYGESEGSSDDDMDDAVDDDAPNTTVIESEFSPGDGTGRAVKLRILISVHSWLELITAECTHEGKAIGSAVARFIRRGSITHEFWEKMDNCSDEAGDVAWTVFTRYALLQEEFKSHPVHRGTGVWGSELDDGPLLLIEQVHITDVQWRRKGIGRAMVRELLRVSQECAERDRPRDMSPAFIALEYGSTAQLNRLMTVHAFVAPGWLTVDVEPQYVDKSPRQKKEINVQTSNTAVAFFRSLGFRRVGSSHFFAYSFDPAHAARSLAPESDFDPQMVPLNDREEEPGVISAFAVEVRLGWRTLAAMEKEFPLHHAATTLSDLDCVEHLRKAAGENEESFATVDHRHKTLLHVLARKTKPESIRWVLAHVPTAQSWKTARDIDGDTPLDALIDFLEGYRTRRLALFGSHHVSDRFRGFPSDAVQCLSLLSETPSSEEDPDISALRRKYGCTCGQCIGGFISPRMKLALLYQAGTLCDFLSQDIADGPWWVTYNDLWLENVAPDVRQNFETNRSLRQGYTNTLSRVYDCLESNIAPSVDNVLRAVARRSEWPPVTRNYLTRAGELPGIAAVLASVFTAASGADDRTGSGDFQQVCASEYTALSPCRNDREFKFVAWACGVEWE